MTQELLETHVPDVVSLDEYRNRQAMTAWELRRWAHEQGLEQAQARELVDQARHAHRSVIDERRSDRRFGWQLAAYLAVYLGGIVLAIVGAVLAW